MSKGDDYYILILAEGLEEEPYLNKIISFKKFSSLYQIQVKNVKGNGNFTAKFQNEWQSGRYELVLFCMDMDNGSEQTNNIIKKIGLQNFGDESIGYELVMFANPVTMLVVLSHLRKIEKLSKSKPANAPIIKEITGIENYTAKEEQIEKLVSLIKYSNYDVMKENLRENSTSPNDNLSTNIHRWFQRFESDDPAWIEKLIDKINKA
ncbi:MAG TPA: hypothetical protein PKO28_04335 [Bacilli bacterium]|nr:hypothetical protein [Bacilli bacterium]